MLETRFHDGFDVPDSVAFGLAAPQLGVVSTAALAGWALLHGPLPVMVSAPLAGLVILVAATLAWARWHERPLLEWAGFALAFATSPRRGAVLLASDEVGASRHARPASRVPEEVEEALHEAEPQPPFVTPAPHRSAPRDTQPSAPWARWLDEGIAEPPAGSNWDEEAGVRPGTPAHLGLADAPDAAEVEPTAPAMRPTPMLSLPILQPPIELEADAETAEQLNQELLDELEAQPEEFGRILPFTRANEDDLPPLPAVAPPRPLPRDAAGTRPAPAAPPAFVGATRRLTFFSLNGGTGKTTLATEVAAILAMRGRHSPDGVTDLPLMVALVDLDLRSSTVAVRIGVPQPTLLDYVTALAGHDADVTDYLVRGPGGLRVLVGSPKPANPSLLSAERLTAMVADLERAGCHFIVFDISGEITPVTSWVLQSVHDIFVVLTPTAGGIQDAYRSTEALRRMGVRHTLRYVVNRTRGRCDVSATMADLGGTVFAEVPWDQALEDAENSHRAGAGTGPAAAALARLAAQLYPGLIVQRRRHRALPWRRWRSRRG